MNRALIISGPEEIGRRLLYALSAPLLNARRSSLFECLSPRAIQKQYSVPDIDFMAESYFVTEPNCPGEFCIYTSFRSIFDSNDIVNLSKRFPELKLIQFSLGFNYEFSGESYQNGSPVGDMDDFNVSSETDFFLKYMREAGRSRDGGDDGDEYGEGLEEQFDEACEKIWKEALQRSRSRTLTHCRIIDDPFKPDLIEFPLVKDQWGFTCLDKFLWQSSTNGRDINHGDYKLINTMTVDFGSFKPSVINGLFNPQQLRNLIDRCEDDYFARSLASYGRIFNGLHVAVLASLEHQYGSSCSAGLGNLLKHCDKSIFVNDEDELAFICSSSPQAMSFLNNNGYSSDSILAKLHFLDPTRQAAFMESYLDEFCPESLPEEVLTQRSKQSYIAYLIGRQVHQMESHHAKRKRARISV